MIKKRILLFLIFYIAVGLIGQYGKTKFTDVGIEYASHLSDFDDREIQIEGGLESKKEYKKHYIKYFDYYVTEWDDCECIVIGEPTGNYISDSYLGVQEVRVLNVLKWKEEELADQTIWISDVDGFKWNEKNQLAMYADYRSLMQEENQYLIFINSFQTSSGLSKEEDLKLDKFGYKNYYSLSGGYFSYLKIDKDTTQLMPDSKEFIYTYGDIKDYEFFCKEEKILEIRNKIKHEIIKRCMEKYQVEG